MVCIAYNMNIMSLDTILRWLTTSISWDWTPTRSQAPPLPQFLKLSVYRASKGVYVPRQGLYRFSLCTPQRKVSKWKRKIYYTFVICNSYSEILGTVRRARVSSCKDYDKRICIADCCIHCFSSSLSHDFAQSARVADSKVILQKLHGQNFAPGELAVIEPTRITVLCLGDQ